MNHLTKADQVGRGDERRAVVVRIGALGDVLLTRRLTYSLSLMGMRSTLVAPGRHASLLKADPWIEETIDSESPVFSSAFGGKWPRTRGAFDVALVISQSDVLAAAAQEAAALVVRIDPRSTSDDIPIARQWAEAARDVTPAFTGALPRLSIADDRAFVRGTTIIHAGSGSPTKNWPRERFIEVGAKLESRGHRVIWLRGPAESHSGSEPVPFEMLQSPSLDILAATLATSRLFVGNDSGVSHLAAATGAPTLALFGPTSDVIWRPDGAKVETLRDVSHRLEAIEVEKVLARIAGMNRLSG